MGYRIVKKFIGLTSHVYTLRVHSKVVNILNDIYTLWIQNFIGDVGNDVSFKRPLILQGGGNQNIKIGKRTKFGSHCILGCWSNYGGETKYNPEIIIGNDCNIGGYTQISALNSIVIGNGLLTGRYVYIGDNSHGGMSLEEAQINPAKRKLKSKGKIIIGNNVWIGDKVTILGGVSIGNNVIIGANSVITHDIQSNSVVGGIPGLMIYHL